jgi:Ca2+-binding RTX toxin-like protein
MYSANRRSSASRSSQVPNALHDAGRGPGGIDTAISDSPSSHHERDRIVDFSHAQGDKISLSAIDARRAAATTGSQRLHLVNRGCEQKKGGEAYPAARVFRRWCRP